MDIIKLDGFTDYKYVFELMKTTQLDRIEGSVNDTVYILEHNSVFTIGKRGVTENLLVSKDFLQSNAIDLFYSTRGGDITYHGPGQIVIYPIINIKELGIGIKDYIFRLEQVVIEQLKTHGIESGRNSLNRGVWVGDSKIASIGVAVSKGVTIHGIAININNSLEPFNMINPCGLKDVTMTSAYKILNKKLDIEQEKNYYSKRLLNSFK